MASASDNDLKSVFEKYAKFGKTEAQAKEMKVLRIETRNVSKMAKETGLLDTKYTSQLLDNDIMRVIGKFTTAGNASYPKGTKTLCYEGFKKLLEQVAESKKSTVDAVNAKVCSSSGPSTAGTTGVANKDNVDRMTDTSKYTGAHKERFDEDGKGKGKDGRENLVENDGYVGNYKGAGTYDKK